MEPKIRRQYGPVIAKIMALVLGVVVIVGVVKVAAWSNRFTKETGLSASTLLRLIIDSGATLKQTHERTNVLLLGVGGGSHDGADLTDTIMVASLDWTKHTFALISVPRDIWSETLKDKVNSAYHYGEEKKKGGGLILARAIIEDVVGIPIHYAVVVDFSGFRNIVNVVGGVDVHVATAFTDKDYPIEGKENDLCDGDLQYRCRYETVHFDAGLQHMDGQRALVYTRSRHAEGSEGTDFARSRRQQEVLIALKARLVQPATWWPASHASDIIKAMDAMLDSDMNIGELATVGKFLYRTKTDNIKRVAIDELLASPPSWKYGRFVLEPIDDWDTIHASIASQLQ